MIAQGEKSSQNNTHPDEKSFISIINSIAASLNNRETRESGRRIFIFK